MRVFLVGASGVIGRAAIRHLVAAGHDVVGTTRTQAKRTVLSELGCQPTVLDLLDAEAVRRELLRACPDVVVNMVTDLSTPPNFRTLDESFRSTNELRTAGTEILLAAARDAGVPRYIGQSFAGWFVQPGSDELTDEQAKLLDPAPRAARRTTAALRHLEQRVLGAERISGCVLRFGPLYGPGTSMGRGGRILDDVRRGKIPVVGGGGGTWSFTHIEDTGRAVHFAVEDEEMTGAFNVVDDEPAPVSAWLPYLAATLGAPAPKSVPKWLARPVVGGFGLHVMTTAKGADNRAVKGRGFTLAVPSWRGGFQNALGDMDVLAVKRAG